MPTLSHLTPGTLACTVPRSSPTPTPPVVRSPCPVVSTAVTFVLPWNVTRGCRRENGTRRTARSRSCPCVIFDRLAERRAHLVARGAEPRAGDPAIDLDHGLRRRCEKHAAVTQSGASGRRRSYARRMTPVRSVLSSRSERQGDTRDEGARTGQGPGQDARLRARPQARVLRARGRRGARAGPGDGLQDAGRRRRRQAHRRDRRRRAPARPEGARGSRQGQEGRRWPTSSRPSAPPATSRAASARSARSKALPTVLDESALAHAAIHVSGGRRGLEIELAPADLLRLTNAVAPIARYAHRGQTPSALGRRRRQRPGERLRVGARAQRVARADVLRERDRHGVVRDRARPRLRRPVRRPAATAARTRRSIRWPRTGDRRAPRHPRVEMTVAVVVAV